MFSKFSFVLCVLTVVWYYLPQSALADTPPDVQREIDRSIAAFPGECPCPYSTDKSGQVCGDKSEYSRQDHKYGYTPFCYPSDIMLSAPAPSKSPSLQPKKIPI